MADRFLGRNFTQLLLLFAWLSVSAVISPTAHAACTGTSRTWDGSSSNRWNNANNWSGNNIPDVAGEDAIIVSATRITRPQDATLTIGCLDVQSGLFRSRNNKKLIITSDFLAPVANTLDIRAADTNFIFEMAGSADQTIDIVDSIQKLELNNTNTITSTSPFNILQSLTFITAGSFVIDADMALESTTNTFTIPSGATVEVTSGNTLTALGGVTVNGTLKIQDGASLVLGDTETLQVNSGGILQLNGVSGNTSTVTGNGAGSSFTFNVAGQITADYFRIDRTDASGLSVTGTIQDMDNGEFHYLASSGYAMTLGSGATVPSTLDYIGFFDDDSHGNTKNIDATNYNVSNFTVSNWSGSAGGASNETDPNARITWGSQASTKLTVSDNTATGNPATTIVPNSADTLFATFAFSLNQADTATDIDSATLTMSGTASSSDISYVKVYKDAGAGTNCVYDSGTDTQVGSNLTLSGSPPEATVNFSTGDVQTSSDSDVACFHVVIATSSVALDSKTIQFKIDGTADVSNSQSYSFSDSSGPPVSAGTSTITNTNLRKWRGKTNTTWNNNQNWWGGASPTSTVDCQIGSGTNNLVMNQSGACQNVQMINGGVTDFNSTTFEIAAYGALDVEASHTFSNDAGGPGVLALRGSTNQSLKLRSAFDGNFLVANTGTSPNDVVNVDDNSEVTGNLTISSGVVKVNAGYTLTVGGNLTVQTGGTLEIAPGATLELGNGSSLTIDAGGTLTMVGTSSQIATVTSDAPASAYTVTVNGTIEARYYKFEYLGTNGVSIESGASINATNYMQDGTFSYPVNSSSTLLKLKRQIPGNTLNDMNFSSAGSAAASVTNIDTTGAGAGTLTINTYSGDWSGLSYDTDPSYAISWSGASTTIDITQEATGPAGVDAGSTYNMGRFGFQQADAGASFSDADITLLKLTLTGTGSASDVSTARLFYDSDCNSTGGTQIGSGGFSGNPATVTFNIAAGDATLQADASSPPLRCIYVEYDIANGATDGKTVGVKINSSADFTNDQTYAISGSTAPPITLGTSSTITGSNSTIWTGTTDTDWFTAGNWSAGLPDATKDCQIDDVTNDPVIDGSGTATCKTITIGTGSLTLQNAVGAVLEIQGNISNTGTITQNDGTIRLIDGGSLQSQTVTSSSAISNLSFNLTGNGTVSVGGTSLTLNAVTVQAGSNFDLLVPSGKTLVLPNGITISETNFVVDVQGGGTLEIGNGQTLTVSGGTFKTSGTNDGYPQSTANKGKVTVQTSGTWSFSSTSGTVSLTGFIMDYLDTNGMVFGGTTTLSALDGGQLTNLSNSYSSVKGFQFNTSSIPATASYIGWNWGPNNTVPATSETYTLASSSGCGSNAISFDQWFGDFFVNVYDPVTSTKVSTTSCTINIAASASPVSIVSFAATGFDDEVALEWETGSELNHFGFNVYRSTEPYSGFTQINTELVRNSLHSSSYRGNYHFLDKNVNNGNLYYYMIEDIDINGATELHGPVSTIPLAGLGSAPAPGGDINSGTTDPDAAPSDPTPGDVENPFIRDLGNGAFLLAETQTSLRLLIEPPAASYSASSWNGSYDVVSMPGYGNSLEPGIPELLERVLLIEVDSSYTSIGSDEVSLSEGAGSTHLMAPTPAYAVDTAGLLQPSYSPDATAYADSNYAPSNFYKVSSETQELNGKHFVKVTLNPLLFRGSDNSVRLLQKLVLDVVLDGVAWSEPNPPQLIAESPSAAPSVLRIKAGDKGFYRLSFSDLENTGTAGPFSGTNTDSLRMYYKGSEVAIDVDSADSSFGGGDSIVFYFYPQDHLEDDLDEIVLSPYPLDGSGPPLRMPTVNGDPSGSPNSTATNTYKFAEFEENNFAVLDRPHGSDIDHYYWARIYDTPGGSPYAVDATANLDLPSLDSSSAFDVRVTVDVRALASYAVNPQYKMSIHINGMPFAAGEESFYHDSGWTKLTFNIPSSYFAPGVNTFKFKAMPDYVASHDWITIDINKFRVDYFAYLSTENNQAEVFNHPLDQAVEVTGFTGSGIDVYDTSEPTQVHKISNVSVSSPDAGATYSAKWRVNDNGSDDLAYRYSLLADTEYKSVSQAFLSRGYSDSLKSPANVGDLVIIGPDHLLEAVRPLIDHRAKEGVAVSTVTPDQIYAEFGHGVKSSAAIRDFLVFAKNNWVTAPAYVLILGDGTNDPRNHSGNSLSEDTFPVPFVKGTYSDFGSDNWFVTEDGSMLPFATLGRIPSNDPNKIAVYIDKVIRYENGEFSPVTSSRVLSFFTDTDSKSEDFVGQATTLMNTLKSSAPDAELSLGQRSSLGDDGFRQSVISELNKGPLMLTYLGHGAESMWADMGVFDNSHVVELTNDKLPIVMALNCFNARFEDADPDKLTIAEEFITREGGGAAVFLGSTTLTTPAAQLGFATAFYNELASETAQTYHTVRIGDLVAKAKGSIAGQNYAHDIVKSYTIMGDPMLKLPSASFKETAPEASNSSLSDGGGGGGGCGLVAPTDIGPGGGGNLPPFVWLLFVLPLLIWSRMRGGILT